MKTWRKPFDLDKLSAPSGELRIIKDRCKGCSYCVEFCPCKVLQMSEEFNIKGYHPPMMVPGKVCLMCGLCQALCPEFAIYLVKPDEEKKTT
jgi:2-oxoglutarate ferredoxin oxidoreductase subunit delta